jgi:hypothetical protein
MRGRLKVLAVVGAIFAVVLYGVFRVLVEDDTTPGICELHNIPYSVETIEVSYGLQRIGWDERTEAQRKWREEEHAAWHESFRYSYLANGAGGCVVRMARFARVSYCPECRKADEAWHAEHGHSPPVEQPK